MARTVFGQRRIFDARRRLALFARDQRGVTAIEFSILALPFFGLLAAIMQTAMLFLSAQILETAVFDSARLVQTGQAKAFSHGQFKTRLCNELYGLLDCTQLKLKVTTVGMTPPAAASPLDSGGAWKSDWANPTDYAPGTGGSVVMVQAYYKWHVPINVGGFFGASGVSSDGTQLLGASYVFMNEPF